MEANNYFSLEKVFPDADQVFQASYKHLHEVRHKCIFVFDTNILLVPYDVSEANISAILDIFVELRRTNRLFIPARVAREFAKQRGEKISQIFLRLRQKQQKINVGHYKMEQLPLERVRELKIESRV